MVDYESIASHLKPFDESVIWDPGMDPFPPSRAEAVRIARERGVGLGEKILPEGKTTQPISGLLYFPMEKQKLKNMNLLYGGKENRITLRFKN